MLPNYRLTGLLQDRVSQFMYSDAGSLIKRVATGEYDEYNKPITQDVAISFDCSFNDSAATEDWRDFADVEVITCEVRFAKGLPEKGDIFRLDKRFGTSSFKPETYEIVGIRDRGSFGWVCGLKRVKV